jgi:hypothetical protein
MQVGPLQLVGVPQRSCVVADGFSVAMTGAPRYICEQTWQNNAGLVSYFKLTTSHIYIFQASGLPWHLRVTNRLGQLSPTHLRDELTQVDLGKLSPSNVAIIIVITLSYKRASTWVCCMLDCDRWRSHIDSIFNL